MRRVLIVQARMTSTRLPGKVLMDVAGRPMLAQQLSRLQRCRLVDDIVVATTVNATDDPVVTLAREMDVRWFRGSENDVLGQYIGAAREADADMIVRVTADCPLVDPEVTDGVIDTLVARRDRADYAANVVDRTFPRGLDTEAFWRDTLERADRIGRSEKAREHVTWVINAERADLFLRASVTDEQDNSDLRWTVDERADLDLVRRLSRDLNLGAGGRHMAYRDLVRHVRAHRDLMMLNAGVVQQ